MDSFLLLRFIHFIGLTLIGAGLIGVFICDMRSRQTKELPLFGQLVSMIALFYDGLVVPGAILLIISGTWMIVEFHDGWEFLQTPWLAGMVFLFIFEFVEGNTITRIYFLRLRKLTKEAVALGQWTSGLRKARGEQLASFTHFLDIPILTVIISLGALRPTDWTTFFIGIAIGLTVATLLNIIVPKLYPWSEAENQ
ncbi:MAG: DUF2269 domain-containing protein [Rhodospirillales bacterium]|nr:DUF2269 domain-containing protein [Rhodospirillales bacterium]